MMSFGPRPRFALLLLGVAWLVVGCRGGGSARLQGHWRGVRTEGVSGEALASANAFATHTAFDISGDMLTVRMPGVSQTGHYRVLREDDASVTVATEKDGPESGEVFVFANPTTFRWAPLPGKTLVFERE